MEQTLLIATGTSGSGKSTVVSALLDTGRFAALKATTTRRMRSANEETFYDFVSGEEFAELSTRNAFITEIEYRGQQYGITYAHLDHSLSTGLNVVATVAPESVEKFRADLAAYRPGIDCISIFLDAPDETLLRRLGLRGPIPVDVTKQQERDRRTAWNEDYRIFDLDQEDILSVIDTLLSINHKSGILSGSRIIALGRAGILLGGFSEEMVQGASYDLRLGDEYFYAGSVRRLTHKSPFLMIEPYDYAIVTSLESACLPADVCARFGLSISLFCQGLVLSNGPQVDPGFRGSLFCLLFNTSNRPVVLKRGQHFSTLEFERLMERAAPYAGSKQDRTSIIDYLPVNSAVGAINELKVEVEALKQSSNSLQTFLLGTLSLTLALVAILVSLR